MTMAVSSALQSAALINALQSRHRVLRWVDEMAGSLHRWTRLLDSAASDFYLVYGPISIWFMVYFACLDSFQN